MKSLRARAGLGFLATAALLGAAWPSLPQASAGAPTPGLALAWTPSTPAHLGAGDPATARLTFVADDQRPAGPVVVDLLLSNASFDGVPTDCLADGSHSSTDGLRLTCDLGAASPGQVLSADLPVTVGGAAPRVALQAGPYDDAGTVLVHSVDAVTPTSYSRLLSSPDFLNADIADLSKSPWDSWNPRKPNSWNAAYEAVLDKILADWASFDPDAVTVIGDLVNGRWIKDPDRLAMFGRVDTRAQRRETVKRAANTYYAAWVQRFRDAGLVVYPGIGDHDLGDNPWKGTRLLREKRGNAPLYRRLFAKYLTRNANGSYRFDDRPVGTPWEGTSYAVRPAPEVQLVMLDVFSNTADDTVAEVTGGQLTWLEGVLSRARADGVDWIVVQGHVPILGPVRRGPSSGLMYQHGSHSALWSLFQQYGVDAYLSGEVHSSTAVVRDGIVQVSHGGNVGYGGSASSRGGTSFVVADFTSADLTLRLYSWNRTHTDGRSLWQMGGNRIPEYLYFHGAPVQVGSITLTANGSSAVNPGIVVGRTGLLAAFDPATEPGAYSPELP